jgi:hypothetical protein
MVMASSPEDHRPARTQRDAPPRRDAPSLASIEDVLADPSTSSWLKAALKRAIARDPVTALNDALVLAALLEERLRIDFDIDVDRPQEDEE